MADEEIEAIFPKTSVSVDVGFCQATDSNAVDVGFCQATQSNAVDVGFCQATQSNAVDVGFCQTTHSNAEKFINRQICSSMYVGKAQTIHSNLATNHDTAEKIRLRTENQNATTHEHIPSKKRPLTQTLLPDELTVSISQMLKGLSSLSPNRCIYRVHLNLREVNPKAFTPKVISIGPLHRGNKRLRTTEKNKLHYLQTFLHLINLSIDDCVNLVRSWEAEARSCYAETIGHNRDEFAKIILLDGCFVVVFILVYFNLLSIQGDHPLNGQTYLATQVIMDMMLLENQLPFFVIERLYRLVISCTNQFNANSIPKWKEFPPTEELVCAFLERVTNVNIPDRIPPVHHFVDLLRFFYNPTSKRQGSESTANACREIFSTPSATHLHAAGVKIERATGSAPMDIEFTNGVLKIHHLLIQEGTEIIFRNLLAFEQLHGPDESITAYLCFLDKLIDTPSDVDFLIEAGVISSIGGSNEDVCKLFNKIWHNANLTSGAQFSCVCKDLNAYCKTPWHKWKATLKREYLSTPWKVMGIIVGFSLLILTFIQAVCSILTAG